MKRIVVVLGMGRSGTSLACQALAQMGVSFGGPLLGANENNERGHWEHIPIKNAQVRLCQEYFGVSGWLTRSTIRDPGPCSYEEQLLEIVRAEVQRWPLFGFKDPMTARLLPLWQRVFHRLELEPVYVKCLRSVEAIHASLCRALPGQNVEFKSVQEIWAIYKDALDSVPGAAINFDAWRSFDFYEPELCHAGA